MVRGVVAGVVLAGLAGCASTDGGAADRDGAQGQTQSLAQMSGLARAYAGRWEGTGWYLSSDGSWKGMQLDTLARPTVDGDGVWTKWTLALDNGATDVGISHTRLGAEGGVSAVSLSRANPEPKLFIGSWDQAAGTVTAEAADVWVDGESPAIVGRSSFTDTWDDGSLYSTVYADTTDGERATVAETTSLPTASESRRTDPRQPPVETGAAPGSPWLQAYAGEWNIEGWSLDDEGHWVQNEGWMSVSPILSGKSAWVQWRLDNEDRESAAGSMIFSQTADGRPVVVTAGGSPKVWLGSWDDEKRTLEARLARAATADTAPSPVEDVWRVETFAEDGESFEYSVYHRGEDGTAILIEEGVGERQTTR